MNSVNISGRLVRDPEMRGGSTSVVHITVAVDGYNRSTKEKEADFFNVVVFGQQAEFVNSYGAKGREVSVSGRLHNNQWTDKNTGEKKSRIEIIADAIELHGPKEKRDSVEGLPF